MIDVVRFFFTPEDMSFVNHRPRPNDTSSSMRRASRGKKSFAISTSSLSQNGAPATDKTNLAYSTSLLRCKRLHPPKLRYFNRSTWIILRHQERHQILTNSVCISAGEEASKSQEAFMYVKANSIHQRDPLL